MPKRVKSPEQKERHAAYMRDWYAKHPDYRRDSARRAREREMRQQYGMDLSDKQRMAEEQGNKCAICAAPFKNSADTHVDHCHASGAVRGILCRQCNTRLGWFEKRLEAVLNYLKRG